MMSPSTSPSNMEYLSKFNKPIMKAPYKLIQLIGTESSGKDRLTAKFNSCGTRPFLSEFQPGLIPPREFIFDPSPVPLAPTRSFIAAMQMIATKLTGSYFPQELVDKLVIYLIDLHPRPGQRAIHCSILRLLGTEAWPRNREIRQLGTHPLDYASVTILCYNASDYQSFRALRTFWKAQRGYSYPLYLRKWMFLVATSEGNCTRAVSRREELALISDVRHQRILSLINPRSPASLDSYNLKCDTGNMVEVENVYQSVVNAIGWTNMYDENLRKTDEKELEIIKSV